MSEIILSYEAAIRLGFFFALFFLLALWESVTPRRTRSFSRRSRWPSNMLIAVVNTVLLRILAPVAATGLALTAAENGWGLLNHLPLPYWFSRGAGCATARSCHLFTARVVSCRARLLAAAPNCTTPIWISMSPLASRFHPLEMLLSMAIKLGVVVALGPPAVAVVMFEVLLNATSLFNHSNVYLPQRLDRALRWFVVTPDMHRVHHSILAPETNSNFGFNLPWWDRLLGTYRAQPANGHEHMIIGLERFRNPARSAVWSSARATTGRRQRRFFPVKAGLGGRCNGPARWPGPVLFWP